MDIKKLFGTIVISAIVVLALMNFTIIVQRDNNSNQTITDNDIINDSYGDLIANLPDAETSAQSSLDTFGATPSPTDQLGELEVTPIRPSLKALRSLSLGTYNILIKLPARLLGVPPVVVSILSAIIILLLIIGAWAVRKGAISN